MSAQVTWFVGITHSDNDENPAFLRIVGNKQSVKKYLTQLAKEDIRSYMSEYGISEAEADAKIYATDRECDIEEIGSCLVGYVAFPESHRTYIAKREKDIRTVMLN